MKERESDIRPVTDTNYICDVVYPQAVQKFFSEIDVSRWTKMTACPICDAPGLHDLFTKNGFNHSGCGRCGHQVVNPMPDPESIRHWYATSEHHKAFNHLIEKVSEQRREILYKKRLEQLLGITAFESVLEIGCGTGGFLKYVTTQLPRVKVYGCDLAEHAVQLCRAQGIEAFHCGAETLDYANHKFDVIVLYEVIEHFIDPRGVLEAIAKAAPSGTRVVLSTPNNDGFDFKMLGRTYRGYLPPGHLHLFSRESIRTLFTKLGYSSVEVLGNGRLDASIVKSYYENNRFEPDAFWKARFEAGDDAFLEDFQALLIKHHLSGNMLVHARV